MDLAQGKSRKPGPPQGFLSSEQIGHRSHGGMGLLSATAFSAARVLRTVAITKIADGPSDGGWDEAIIPQNKWDPFLRH